MRYRILQDSNWSGYYVGQIVTKDQHKSIIGRNEFWSLTPNSTGHIGLIVKYRDAVPVGIKEYLKLIKTK